MKNISKKLRIYGRVQGVYYRAWGKETAQKLELSGWIKNCADGSVEAVISGREDMVLHFIADCHEGPLAAKVDNIEVQDTETNDSGDFKILENA